MPLLVANASATNPRHYNGYFLGLVAQRYADRLAHNGALTLNAMIQERCKTTEQEAFALIADAIEDGFISVDRDDDRRLSFNKIQLDEMRDVFVDGIYQMHCEIVSANWNFHRPLRKELTQPELQTLDKYHRLDRLKDVQEAMSPMSPEINAVAYIEGVFRKVCPTTVIDPPVEVRERLMRTMKEPIQNLANVCGDEDFVFMLEKRGHRLIPKFKVIKRDPSVVEVDWSQV